VATVQLWADVLAALPRLTRPARLARLPRALPIHLIAGTRDPVSNGTRALRSLLAAYRAAGLSRVSHRFYEGARHELFHESNRDAVIADLLSWLDDLARHGSLEPRQGDG
jgi:alpha-beta hydrolase superfamily lysophospholipase